MANFPQHEAAKLQEFLETVHPWSAAYADATFGFVGLKQGKGVKIIQGHLVLPGNGAATDPKHIETDTVVGGCYRLRDTGETFASALTKLSVGALQTPYGQIH